MKYYDSKQLGDFPRARWEAIKNRARFEPVREWLKFLSPQGVLVDVGCFDVPAIHWCNADWRICVDLQRFPDEVAGAPVLNIQGDWLEVTLPAKADLLLCLETIEHQTDDRVLQFTQKLLDSSRMLLVSVPHNWTAGLCRPHWQDPINPKKLQRLMHGRRPVKQLMQRNFILALYRGNAS